ncbi:MAG: pentapeptide repeat-containing protein [bacterium]|nr:pentapeptide repeat-containing protein [bacterium]
MADKQYSQEQYDMLKRCSDKKDMIEWNEWREKNPNEDILLEGANFQWTDLQGADLQGANLRGANLQEINLQWANLQGADLQKVNLQWAKLQGINLQWTNLQWVNLQGANLQKAKLQGAKLLWAKLEEATLQGAKLLWANLLWADLNGCVVNENTDFTGVGLSTFRTEPKIRQQLAKNIRRKNWEKWYKEHWYSTFTKRLFGVFFVLSFIFALIYWGGRAF